MEKVKGVCRLSGLTVTSVLQRTGNMHVIEVKTEKQILANDITFPMVYILLGMHKATQHIFTRIMKGSIRT